MSRQIAQFSYHAKKRLHERTKLRMSDVKRLFGKGLFYIVGTDEKETHIFHCLVYSKPDNQPYIILLNSNNNIVVSVLYFDYQSWNIDYNLVYDLKYKQEDKNQNTKKQNNKKNFSILDLEKNDNRSYLTIKRLINAFFDSQNKKESQLTKYFLYVLSQKYTFPISELEIKNLNFNDSKKMFFNKFKNNETLINFFIISHMAKFNIPDLSNEPINKIINIITSGYPSDKNILLAISEAIYKSNIVSNFKKLSMKYLLSQGYFDTIVKSRNQDLNNLINILKESYPEIESKLNKIDLSKDFNFLNINYINQFCNEIFKNNIKLKKNSLKKKLIITTKKSKISYELSGNKENLEDYFYHDFLSSKKAEVLNICEQDVESVIFVHKDNIENRII